MNCIVYYYCYYYSYSYYSYVKYYVIMCRHHSATAMRLLFSSDHFVFENCSMEDINYFRTAISRCILGTDMARHFEHVETLHFASNLDRPFNISEPQSQLDLVKNIIHCADISGQILDKELSIEWGRRCIEEFKQQANNERRLGLSVTQFMDGLDNDVSIASVQYGYVKNIVLPLWQALVECFPSLKFCIDQGEKNCLFYKNSMDNKSAPDEARVNADVLEITSTVVWNAVSSGTNSKKKKKKI